MQLRNVLETTQKPLDGANWADSPIDTSSDFRIHKRGSLFIWSSRIYHTFTLTYRCIMLCIMLLTSRKCRNRRICHIFSIYFWCIFPYLRVLFSLEIRIQVSWVLNKRNTEKHIHSQSSIPIINSKKTYQKKSFRNSRMIFVMETS